MDKKKTIFDLISINRPGLQKTRRPKWENTQYVNFYTSWWLGVKSQKSEIKHDQNEN
jgi:hypothetical protein